ncbi:hypothetical protein Pyn_32237 [Prunus yedoensis var. nudiflora]|uniref:Uncharacterized protein n=1 Tax=Prunus yedoensis var. nudiflora TaxID=2094558 RepID=A0A314UBY0_PRUYE|nr:hypothetical protein Pyn_32237 [Prunus yedoensis var. nudiflora]
MSLGFPGGSSPEILRGKPRNPGGNRLGIPGGTRHGIVGKVRGGGYSTCCH